MYRRLQTEYPEFLEMQHILSISGEAWPRHGIDADQVSQMDPFTRDMLVIALGL